MAPNIDLHVHSTFSDGNFSPTELVVKYAGIGVRTLAITDHDTIAQLPEAFAAGKQHGMRIISGAELSAVHEDLDLHMLILDFDPGNVALGERLAYFGGSRENRSNEIMERIQQLGIMISHDEVRRAAKGIVGKPHIALAALAEKDNQKRFATDGVHHVDSFIKSYLAKGKPAYVAREKISAEEAIDLAHQAGGKAFWAHPKLSLGREFKSHLHRRVDQLYVLGLDGLEVFHSEHRQKWVCEALREVVRDYNLLESAGSDYHGPQVNPYLNPGEWKSFGLHPDFSWLEK